MCICYISTRTIDPLHLIQGYVYLTVYLVHNATLIAIKIPLQRMPAFTNGFQATVEVMYSRDEAGCHSATSFSY